MTDHRLLTASQLRFADLLRSQLIAANVQFAEHVDDYNGHEQIVVFDIKTPPSLALTVRIVIVDDVFIFEANGAQLRRDRAAWPADAVDQWIEECLQIVSVLIDSDLRIRIRRTLLGGVTGAIWIPQSAHPGAWSGEIRATRGEGQEFVFESWSRMPVE